VAPGRAPNLKLERTWLADGHLVVAGSDEVGRGALGGPVSAGVVLVDVATRRPPTGLRDSKLLTRAAREALVPRIERWAVASAVGHASAAEIDAFGILRALRLAGERALAALGTECTVVVLDGNYDWFRRPDPVPGSPLPRPPDHVELRIKADLVCASVASASVLAKVTRDRLMEDLAREHPAYGWDVNRGYATPEHLDALRELGACCEHRRSWRLPGVPVDQLTLDLDAPSLDAPSLGVG
jgi:ribonuclease HII